MKLRLSDVASMLGVEPPSEEREITGYSIDSRSVQPGELFFAIRGPHHDGHAYAAAAVEAGAAAVIAERTWAAANAPGAQAPGGATRSTGCPAPDALSLLR